MHVLKVTNNIEKKLEKTDRRREERKSRLLQKVEENIGSLAPERDI